MYRIVGSILVVLVIVGCFMLANGGDESTEAQPVATEEGAVVVPADEQQQPVGNKRFNF